MAIAGAHVFLALLAGYGVYGSDGDDDVAMTYYGTCHCSLDIGVSDPAERITRFIIRQDGRVELTVTQK